MEVIRQLLTVTRIPDGLIWLFLWRRRLCETRSHPRTMREGNENVVYMKKTRENEWRGSRVGLDDCGISPTGMNDEKGECCM